MNACQFYISMDTPRMYLWTGSTATQTPASNEQTLMYASSSADWKEQQRVGFLR